MQMGCLHGSMSSNSDNCRYYHVHPSAYFKQPETLFSITSKNDFLTFEVFIAEIIFYWDGASPYIS